MPQTDSFFELFRKFIESTEKRLREVEAIIAAFKQELKSLKDDRCARHVVEIQKLFDGQDRLSSSLGGISATVKILDTLYQQLDQAVRKLDKHAIKAVVDGEDSAEKINNLMLLNPSEKLRLLDVRLTTLEESSRVEQQREYDYRFALWGAIIGIISSIISGIVIYLLTQGVI